MSLQILKSGIPNFAFLYPYYSINYYFLKAEIRQHGASSSPDPTGIALVFVPSYTFTLNTKFFSPLATLATAQKMPSESDFAATLRGGLLYHFDLNKGRNQLLLEGKLKENWQITTMNQAMLYSLEVYLQTESLIQKWA